MNIISKIIKKLRKHFSGKKEQPKPIALLPFNMKPESVYRQEKREIYKTFIQLGEPIKLDEGRPTLSAVIHSNKQPEDTFASLKSIIQHAGLHFNLIFLHPDKEKSHYALFNKIDGAEIISPGDSDLLKKSIRESGSEYLLFLKSGAEITGELMVEAHNSVGESCKASSFCGKVVSSPGNLLEAGVAAGKDGSLNCIGKGDNQSDAKYNFSRFVECGSGKFFMTKSELYADYCNRDSSYQSMSYLIADYCNMLRENGEYILYNPEIIVKYSTSSRFSGYFNYQNRRDRVHFHRLNREKQKRETPKKRLNAMHSSGSKEVKRVLYIDDLVPHYSYGAGFPRANEIVHEFINMGIQVTLYPNSYREDDTWNKVYQDINRGIEFVQASVKHRFRKLYLSKKEYVDYKRKYRFRTFLESRKEYFDYIWISRPNNLRAILPLIKTLNKKAKIIYDAECIYAERELQKSKYADSDFDDESLAEKVREEIELCKIADAVIVVSKADQEKFISMGVKNTFVLGHIASESVTPANYDARKDLLFIGNLEHEESPNTDSIQWFIKHVFPILEDKLPDINLHLVGSCKSSYLLNLKSNRILVHGRVDDTTEYYKSCKVFIAPTRFSGGIPLKIIEAASFGIPVVATNLLKRNLVWVHGQHLLACEPDGKEFSDQIIKLYTNRQLWEGIRANALEKVQNEYSPEYFKKVIKNVFNSLEGA